MYRDDRPRTPPPSSDSRQRPVVSSGLGLRSGSPPCWVARRVAIEVSGGRLRYGGCSACKHRWMSDAQRASIVGERSSCRLTDKADSWGLNGEALCRVPRCSTSPTCDADRAPPVLHSAGRAAPDASRAQWYGFTSAGSTFSCHVGVGAAAPNTRPASSADYSICNV
jgi:hypothetical protein